MSILLRAGGVRPARAIVFNRRAAATLGWLNKIPEAAIAAFPGLEEDPTSASLVARSRFAAAVAELQRSLCPGDPTSWDGMLGNQTWMALLRAYDHVSPCEPYLLLGGRRVATPEITVPVYTWESDAGYDLHPYGRWSRRPDPEFRNVVVHWGGLDPRSCKNALVSNGVSSNIGIGLVRLDLNTGPKWQAVVYQWLDLQHRSWHAGRQANQWSVGIDICEHPLLEWRPWYEKRCIHKEIIDNPTERGWRKVLALTPEVAAATRQVVQALCRVLGVPYVFPRGKDGLAGVGPVWHGTFPEGTLPGGGFRGVCGHHHVSAAKTDIAPWWPAVFPEGD